MARSKVQGNIDQWKLIGILIIAIKNLKEDVWVKSFKKVNLHPKFRVDYENWMQRIHPHIVTGEAAYTRKNTTSLYDAMPALWKNLTVANRHAVLSNIDEAIATAEGGNPWVDKMHLINMSRFVDLKNVPKLRICHQVAKHDPSVIIGARIALEHSDEESDAEESDGDHSGDGALVVYDPNKNPPPQQTNLNTFLLKPPSLTVAIDKAVDKRSARMVLFSHMVAYRNRRGYKEEKQTVSSFLDFECTCDQ